MLAIRAILVSGRTIPSLERSTCRQLSMALNTTGYSSIKNIQATAAPAISTNSGINRRIFSISGSTERRNYATKVNDADKENAQLQRIYYGPLAPRMKAVKVLSITTSIVGLAVQPILMEQGMKLGGTGMAVLLCSFAGVFTFVTPFLLHFITKKYVTEIHYNAATEEYTATTISFLLQKIQTKFRVGDVIVPEVPGMFTSFLVDKKPLFVDPSLFDDPEHYVRMMGYDKPVDFKLNMKKDTATETKRIRTGSEVD